MFPEVAPLIGFQILLVFVRVGVIFMIVPALGEQSVPARFRLVLSLAFSFLLYQVISDKLPPIPETPIDMAILAINEVLVGVVFGTIIRMITTSLHVAGTVIGFQTGLAAAQQFDPNQGQSGAILASFFGMLGLITIFVLDLHHLIIAGVVNTYSIFPAGEGIDFGSAASLMTETVASSFKMGLMLSAPFLVYGLIFNTGMGIVARLMPQFPIFFIALPLNVFMGFSLLFLVIGGFTIWFGNYFENQLQQFLP